MSGHTYTGRCLCGSVKYKLESEAGDVRGVTACHCLQCRQWSGHHWASVHGPMSGFQITEGESNVSWYQSSEYARRGFCKICGSGLFWHGNGYPSLVDQIDVSAGSVDDLHGLSLSRHIFCRFKGDYYELKDGVPTFDTFPGA